MKRIVYPVVVVIILLGILYAVEVMDDKNKLQDLKKLNTVLQDPALTIKGAVEKPDSYILKLEAKSPRGSRKFTAFLMKKNGELYIGSGYDKEGKEIVFPADAKIVKDGVSFSYGKGKKEIYLVTDPECPFCSRFEKDMQGKLDDYTVHVILFPLSFHKKSPAMVEWIMQGKSDAEKKERFETIMLQGSEEYKKLIKDEKRPFVYSPEVQRRMDASKQAVSELDVRGTPAVYDADFHPLSPAELLKAEEKKGEKK